MRKTWLGKLTAGAAVMIALAVVLAACGGGGGATAAGAKAPSNVSPTWITPTVSDTSVSIPLDTVQAKYDTHFKVTLDKGTAYFMAYTYGGKTYVRANVCVPCQSVSFSLVKGTLVCDTCGTVFSAGDGSGISGACVRYPKAAVPYQTTDGNIVMTKADLTKAFENTLSPGLP
jgi:nitrite reductase/ring-hydroxylating ferredoxin subunit